LIRSYLLDRVHPRKRRDRLRSRLDRTPSSRAKDLPAFPCFSCADKYPQFLR
jgi:hypothetical protein